MNKVVIFPNALDAQEHTVHETDDLCGLLQEQFAKFPDTAKIYHDEVAVSNDVTPYDEAGIKRLQEMKGNFVVVVWPEDIVTIVAIVAIAIAAIALVVTFLFRPQKNGQNEGSPNNELTDRQNRARPNERIADIYGTVRSTPDLLALPYKAFVNNQEFEYCYMCVSRGSVDVLDCRDDSTPVDDINGEFVAVYPPFNSPNSLAPAPQATFGVPPTTIPPVVTVQKSNSVNGQVLRAPNSGNLTSNNNISFTYGGIINCNDANIDFTQYFVASSLGNDQFLQIFTNDDGLNASDPAGIVHSVGLAGTYKILAVTSGSITLSSPALVNANWNTLNTFSGAASTYYHTFRIQSIGDKWVGPYILNVDNMVQVWANLVGQNGLYYVDNKGRQGALTVTVLMEITAVDSTLTPVGNPVTGTVNLTGSSLTRNIVGSTLRMALPSPGPCQVRMKLLTPMGVDTRNTYVQEIQWRDLYAVSNANFDTPPPIVIPAGHSMAWATPGFAGPSGSLTIPPSIWNFGQGVSGSSDATDTEGFAILVGGDSLADPSMGVSWSGFTLPSNFPVGATITGIYIACSGVFTGSDATMRWTKTGGTGLLAFQGFSGDILSGSIGNTLADLTSLSIALRVENTAGGSTCNASISNLRVAVYYSTPGSSTILEPRIWALGDFGNVTTCLSITANTPDALTIKERKLNMLVTRKLPTWYNRGVAGPKQFTPTLAPTNNAADIFCAICLDPYIGNRALSEIDVAEIYGVADALYLGGEHVDGSIANYFGTFLMTEFCYTFDDSKISFEEMLADIAQTINCTAYRNASTIGISFEKATNNSKMLFNHRNKLPGSETRTFTFGQLNDNDGITYDYIDPNAPNLPAIDTTVALYFPTNKSAVNPKKFTSTGVRNPIQATINAQRLWNKLQYAKLQTEFTATWEATERLLNDRVLVADNTRPDTQDGDCVAKVGLIVTTSQALTFVGGHTYTAFFQHYDDTVEAIAVTAGPTANSMTLAAPPSVPLITDPQVGVPTFYIVVDDADTTSGKKPIAFLISSKDPQDNGTFTLKAIGYDARFYSRDLDVINGLLFPPIAGYSAQGYIGIGYQKADGSTYVAPRSPFNAGSYTNNPINAGNNVPTGQQVTTQPLGSSATPTVQVNEASTGAELSDFNDSTPVAPALSRLVKWAKSGDTDLQKISAYMTNLVGDTGAGGANGLVPAPAAGDGALGKVLRADGAWSTVAGGIVLSIYGSSVPNTGLLGFVQIPYNAKVIGWTIVLNDPAGSAQFDVKKSTYAAYPTTASIVASAAPTCTTARKATSTVLTGWTTALNAGDIVEVYLTSVTTATILSFLLQLQRVQ